MKDIIWTVIILWIVWKVYNAFKTVTKTRTQPSQHNYTNQSKHYNSGKEGDVKIDLCGIKKISHFKSNDGEFVDYEEVK